MAQSEQLINSGGGGGEGQNGGTPSVDKFFAFICAFICSELKLIHSSATSGYLPSCTCSKRRRVQTRYAIYTSEYI